MLKGEVHHALQVTWYPISCRLVSQNPDVGLEAVVQLSQQLSVNQRSQVVKLLTTMDDLNTTTCSNIDET